MNGRASVNRVHGVLQIVIGGRIQLLELPKPYSLFSTTEL
jgi:hypothetical protein